MKNILITSGGTTIKLDDVRTIGNFSGGKLMSSVAEKALLNGNNVWFLYAKKSIKPFQNDFIFDPNSEPKSQIKRIKKTLKIYNSIKTRLNLIQYETFEEYKNLLKEILEKNQIDIVFLGAAVSDFTAKKMPGKISSDVKELTIKLIPTPKIIQFVKKWSPKPLFQVGFKLLVGVPENELIDSAYKSLLENKSDLVVANDLKKISSNSREVVFVTSEKGVIKISGDKVAESIFDFVIERSSATYFKTSVIEEKKLSQKYKKEFTQIKTVVKQLQSKNLFTPFFPESKNHHGSISIRAGKGFLITARGSNKENLVNEDIVFVTDTDLKNKIIYCESINGKKPSFNAILSDVVFKKFPEINCILHSHQIKANKPTTTFPFVPGTMEYSVEPPELLSKSKVINLKDHGFISTGKTIEEAVNNAK